MESKTTAKMLKTYLWGNIKWIMIHSHTHTHIHFFVFFCFSSFRFCYRRSYTYAHTLNKLKFKPLDLRFKLTEISFFYIKNLSGFYGIVGYECDFNMLASSSSSSVAKSQFILQTFCTFFCSLQTHLYAWMWEKKTQCKHTISPQRSTFFPERNKQKHSKQHVLMNKNFQSSASTGFSNQALHFQAFRGPSFTFSN